MTLAGWIQDTQQSSLADYIQGMQQPNEWGDDVTLFAAVERFQVEIMLWTSTEGNNFLRSHRPHAGGLILDFHYWSLIPVQEGPLGSYQGEEEVLGRQFQTSFAAPADANVLNQANQLLHQPVLPMGSDAELRARLENLYVLNFRGVHFHRRVYSDEQRQSVVDDMLSGAGSASLFSPSVHAKARVPYHRAEDDEDCLNEASRESRTCWSFQNHFFLTLKGTA